MEKKEKNYYIPKAKPELVDIEEYISDFRKIEPDKLKTVLRYRVKS